MRERDRIIMPEALPASQSVRTSMKFAGLDQSNANGWNVGDENEVGFLGKMSVGLTPSHSIRHSDPR